MILPNGTGETASAEGIGHYNRLIDELLAAGIEPLVTLYHWDLPLALQQRGGWLNPDVALWFEEYSRRCFAAFGDKVKSWITLNEPWVVAVIAHGTSEMPPALEDPGNVTYIAAHNQIRAHARAVKAYREDFVGQGGEIGITLSISWKEPKDPNDPTHIEA